MTSAPFTVVWAHRGASGSAPENTLPAFARAHDLGADGVELDVQLTADGVVVVCHDETVDRTSDGSGAIVDMSLDELRRLDFAAGVPDFHDVRIPTLDEVFELLEPTAMGVNVELKNTWEPYPGLPAAVEDVVQRHGMGDRVWYSSFHHPSMRALAASSPVPCALLHADVLVDPWSYGAATGALAMHPMWGIPLIQSEYVQRCHEAGLRVHVWTVNDLDVWQQLTDLGVDAIITNHPELRP